MSATKFPVVVKKGNSTVKIYHHRNGDYDEYKVAFYSSGKRRMETFSDLSKAKARADEINQNVNAGNADALTLSGSQLHAFRRAIEILTPLNVPLELAAMQYVEAVTELRGKASLVEAARFYIKRNPSTVVEKTVASAVEEYIQSKRTSGMSDRYIYALTSRLGRFK